MTRVAVIFPGQGSQVVGMGGDVARRYPAARERFEQARRVLGYDLFALAQAGPEERLRATEVSQPAIFVTNCAIYAAVGEVLRPVVSAGHSFGEFCSLTVAGALEFDEALRLVAARGRLMGEAAAVAPGAMAAVLGLAPEAVRAAVDEATAVGRVQLANFNAPNQIVISGERGAVARAGELATAAGAKRIVPLNVSGAWHSALMEPAVAPFAKVLATATIRPPSFTVISNVDAQPYGDAESIRRNLLRSLTAEVRWHATALRLLAEEPELIVECGASAVLAPLAKRLPNAPRVLHVGDAGGVERLRAELGSSSDAA